MAVRATTQPAVLLAGCAIDHSMLPSVKELRGEGLWHATVDRLLSGRGVSACHHVGMCTLHPEELAPAQSALCRCKLSLAFRAQAAERGEGAVAERAALTAAGDRR